MPDFSQMLGGMGGAGGAGGAGAMAGGGHEAMMQMMENPQMQEQMAQMMAMPGFMVSSADPWHPLTHIILLHALLATCNMVVLHLVEPALLRM